MKILGTVSRRSKGKILIELFQFGGLLMVWALSISYEPRSLFATRGGERCMKGSVHPVRHPRIHLDERASAQARESFARQAKWPRNGTELGWSDPTFAHGSVPKSDSWVAPAQQETSLGARGENLVEAAEEGRNYLLQLRLHHLLQLGMRVSLGKTRK